MSLNRRDVIIVGAGPAGCTLARELARHGVDVLLLEAARLPRSKTCAGGVTVKAAALLPFDIGEVVEDVVYGARVSFRLGAWIEKRSAEPLTYTVMRQRFDHLLARKAAEAGAVVRDGDPVRNVEATGEEVRVSAALGEYRASVVAGADGAGGAVARSLGLMRHPGLDAGLQVEIPLGPDILAGWRNMVALDYGVIPAGYGWAFPKSGCLSVGVGGPQRYAARLRLYLSHLLVRLGLADVAGSARGHLMPFRRPGQRLVAGRCLLLGDAAGLVDPFTGEGIYSAIKSALLAAPAIEHYLREGHHASNGLAAYEASIDAQMMPELRVAGGFARISAWAPRLCFARFREDPRVWTAFCRLLRGEVTYGALLPALGPLGPLVRLASRI